MHIKPIVSKMIAGAFTVFALELSVVPASAVTLRECVRAWQIDFPGISTDRAIQECRNNGFPSRPKPSESKSQCVGAAFETFDLAFYKTVASDKAQKFCSGGGKAKCLSSAHRTFDLAFYKTVASDKAEDFCLKGGSESCLSEAYTTFDKSFYKTVAADKAQEFCIKS